MKIVKCILDLLVIIMWAMICMATASFLNGFLEALYWYWFGDASKMTNSFLMGVVFCNGLYMQEEAKRKTSQQTHITAEIKQTKTTTI